MADIKLFWLEPTDQAVRYLRRYEGAPQGQPQCPNRIGGYHNAKIEIGRQQAIFTDLDKTTLEAIPNLSKSDPRWPKQCQHCDHKFSTKAFYQTGQDLLYKRSDTGQLITLDDAPPGAMWDGHWYEQPGLDGICLVVMTPAGEWLVDSKASNCRKPKGSKEQCWNRSGDPRNPQADPPLHVSSSCICGAGAGSIQIREYHGFLDNGYLRDRRT